jgi:N-sulfoglucosamine sulfohydrolase
MKPLPNILIITTHDTGRYFGCYGVPTASTPAIDALSRTGFQLDRMFAVCPICSPSRASLATGRYPQSHGVTTIVNRAQGIALHPDEIHLAQRLKSAGYTTALCGLQHEIPPSDPLPFDQVIANQPRQSAPAVAHATAGFITESTEPFYAQIGFFETHTPYDFGDARPDDSHGVTLPPHLIDNAEARDWMARLQGALKQADTGVKILLDALEQSGKAGNTLVVFTVDHGLELPRAKWFLYDPGLEVACLVRWPDAGITGGKRADRLCSNVDILPTLLELIGLPGDDRIQGISFADTLLGHPVRKKRDAVFGYQSGYVSRCIRTDDHKLIVNFEQHAPCTCPGDVARPRQDEPISPLVECYDLRSDPLEFNNRIDDPEAAPAIEQLRKRLRAWMVEQNDPLLEKNALNNPFHAQALAWLQT